MGLGEILLEEMLDFLLFLGAGSRNLYWNRTQKENEGRLEFVPDNSLLMTFFPPVSLLSFS